MPLTTELSFRVATVADCPLLAGLNYQLIQDEANRNPLTVLQLEQRMRGFLARPAEIYLRHLFVVRHRRRQGIGRQSMEILRSKIWPKTKRLTVEVLVGNITATTFWRAVGYKDYSLLLEILP